MELYEGVLMVLSWQTRAEGAELKHAEMNTQSCRMCMQMRTHSELFQESME